MFLKGVIIKSIREKMLEWTDKSMVGGFSHDASTSKTLERQLCEVRDTRGQLTARSSISKHSKDRVTSKTNPAHNPTATFEKKGEK